MRRAAALFAFVGLLPAQSSIHNRLQEIYRDFGDNRNLPPLLAFWEDARKQPSQYVDALREELSDRKNMPLLLVDGASRLLFVSDTPQDRAISLDVMAHADFRKLSQQAGLIPYFALVSELARRNESTTFAAFRVLEWPEAFLRIRGALAFDQAMLLLHMLLPADRKYWLNSAAERLLTETDPVAQRSLLSLLWHAQDEFADRELQAFAKDLRKPAASRDYAQQLLARQPNLSALQQAHVVSVSEDALREERRVAMRYVDRPLSVLDIGTRSILAKRRMKR